MTHNSTTATEAGERVSTRWFRTATAAIGDRPAGPDAVRRALRQPLDSSDITELLDAALPYLAYRPASDRRPPAVRHRVYQDWAADTRQALPSGKDAVEAAELVQAAHTAVLALAASQVVAAARAFAPLNSELIARNSRSIDPPPDAAESSSREQRDRLDELAESYRRRFGYTCVVAAAGRHIIDVQREVRARLDSTDAAEIAATRIEIASVMDDRLARALLERIDTP